MLQHDADTRLMALVLYTEGALSVRQVSQFIGVPRETVAGWIRDAGVVRTQDEAMKVDPELEKARLQGKITELTNRLNRSTKQAVTDANIRESILLLRQNIDTLTLPDWLVEPIGISGKTHGVPTLFLSDLHWGERVFRNQLNGVNEFNLDIARERLMRCVESAIHLLEILDRKMNYPAFVLPLGGDMLSGNLHDELTATNEMNTMPTLVDLYGWLIKAIDRLLEVFPFIFVPAVAGNHGKDTKKIWEKDRHATSFDWLLYIFLAKHYEGNDRVKFYVPNALDVHYDVYGVRMKMEHGDRLGRGGDGIIGFLGPVTRGDQKKRSRDTQIGMPYDFMLHGHWHQYNHGRIISNGSLKGYDEYAFNNGFPFEQPQQALWLTHPKRGITYRMPVYLDDNLLPQNREMVTVFEGGK